MKQCSMLALVTDAFGGWGGIAQYNRDFLGALAETSAVSSIKILPRIASEPGSAPLPSRVIRQSPARPGRLAYSAAAIGAAWSELIDIVFCGHLFMAPLAALIARLKGAKLVIQTHGVEAWPRPSSLQRRAIEGADLVLCVSRYTRTAILEANRISPERVIVLPNTVGESFTPGDGTSLRNSLGLKAKRVLLTVARMDSRQKHKGHDRVIATIPGLIARGHDIRYVIAGSGDDRARLENLADSAGISDRVIFLGAVGLDQLVAAYRMADLYVMPSTGEGFGIAFLESMACGTPALGLDIAGAKDALADGELGYCVREGELLSAIDLALRAAKPDPDELARKVRAKFGREVFAARAQAAIEKAMAA